MQAGANPAVENTTKQTPADWAKDEDIRALFSLPVADLVPKLGFEVGEQVFCLDDNNTRRPAQIEATLPDNK